MKLITLASLVISFLVLNYLFRKALSGISVRNVVLDYLRRFLPVMEMIGWTGVTIWLINILFAESRYILHLNTLILLCVFLFISWYVLRDYIAGVQIRSRFNFEAGQKIKSAQVNGEIKRLGLLALSISAENGSNIIIPYSKLEQQSVELNFNKKGLAMSRFIFETDDKPNDSEVMEKLMETLMNSAWCSHKSKPTIQLIGAKDKKKQYEIFCSPTGEEGIEKLKALLKQTV